LACFTRKIDGIRRVLLHAKRQLVGIDHGLQFGVARTTLQLLAIQRLHEFELRLLVLWRT
jgi:hypothetical protein